MGVLGAYTRKGSDAPAYTSLIVPCRRLPTWGCLLEQAKWRENSKYRFYFYSDAEVVHENDDELEVETSINPSSPHCTVPNTKNKAFFAMEGTRPAISDNPLFAALTTPKHFGP